MHNQLPVILVKYDRAIYYFKNRDEASLRKHLREHYKKRLTEVQ